MSNSTFRRKHTGLTIFLVSLLLLMPLFVSAQNRDTDDFNTFNNINYRNESESTFFRNIGARVTSAIRSVAGVFHINYNNLFGQETRYANLPFSTEVEKFIPDTTLPADTLVATTPIPNETIQTPATVPQAVVINSAIAQTNLTTDINLEYRVTEADQSLVIDWKSVDGTVLILDEGQELFVRWDASNYSQCLPFLADLGNYALSRKNDTAMLVGNTHTDTFDLFERTGEYRIECNGQSNGEDGVDVAVLNVLVS